MWLLFGIIANIYMFKVMLCCWTVLLGSQFWKVSVLFIAKFQRESFTCQISDSWLPWSLSHGISWRWNCLFLSCVPKNLVPVSVDVKLSENEKQLKDADNKYEVLSHTLREKQAMCDAQQSHIDVSFCDSLVTSPGIWFLCVTTICLFILAVIKFYGLHQCFFSPSLFSYCDARYY